MEAVTNIGLTAKELFTMPQDDQKTELIKGEFNKMPPTGGRHGIIASRLDRYIGTFVEEHSLGHVCAAETGFILSKDSDTVRAPDVSFISKDKIPVDGVPEEYWELAPDLAVEVLSPSDRASKVLEKVAEYLEAGTKMVWIVDPNTKTVTIYRSFEDIQILTEEDEVDGSDIVPGFQYPLSRIFRE